MTKKEEQQLRDSERTIDFLVNRIIDESRQVRGISSDAMIAEALLGLGHQVDQNDYPHDFDDLSRCLRTWLEAPTFLRAKMLWRLAQYTTHISEKYISVDGVRDR